MCQAFYAVYFACNAENSKHYCSAENAKEYYPKPKPKNTIQQRVVHCSEFCYSRKVHCTVLHSRFHCNVKICCGALHCIFHIAVKSAVQFLREDSSKVNLFFGGFNFDFFEYIFHCTVLLPYLGGISHKIASYWPSVSSCTTPKIQYKAIFPKI